MSAWIKPMTGASESPRPAAERRPESLLVSPSHTHACNPEVLTPCLDSFSADDVNQSFSAFSANFLTFQKCHDSNVRSCYVTSDSEVWGQFQMGEIKSMQSKTLNMKCYSTEPACLVIS